MFYATKYFRIYGVFNFGAFSWGFFESREGPGVEIAERLHSIFGLRDADVIYAWLDVLLTLVVWEKTPKPNLVHHL